uniref:C2H2-type domain-containing protein n=1 Tax=Timema bartmani TaxID=61472 RepID=A0A7R9HYC6_9NEOP|nr:unnamed protein product [Timema bartmani]
MSKDIACDGTVGPNEDGTLNIGHPLAGNISRPSHKSPVCEHCGRCCLTRAELRKHLVTHSTLRPWRCEHCAKSFKRKDNLRHHVRTHERLKTWRCEYCGKSFNSKAVREEHILTHNVTALWSCQTCGKTFARKSSMREHQLTHNRCWVCKRCDRAFERKHDLKRHKVAHKVAETFECHYCHELFDKKGHKMEHLASHAGMKTAFRCEQCGESFSCRSKLDIHLAHHDSTKLFSCSDDGDVVVRHVWVGKRSASVFGNVSHGGTEGRSGNVSRGGTEGCSGNGLPIGVCKLERQCPSREPIETGVLFGAEYRGELIMDGLENIDCGVVQAVERVGGAACASAEERDKGRLNNTEPMNTSALLYSSCQNLITLLSSKPLIYVKYRVASVIP